MGHWVSVLLAKKHRVGGTMVGWGMERAAIGARRQNIHIAKCAMLTHHAQQP